jgi:hypothetical protein
MGKLATNIVCRIVSFNYFRRVDSWRQLWKQLIIFMAISICQKKKKKQRGKRITRTSKSSLHTPLRAFFSFRKTNRGWDSTVHFAPMILREAK